MSIEKSRHITMAYFDQKSTVDYIGAPFRAYPSVLTPRNVRFPLPLQNVHAHQVEFMREFEAQGGGLYHPLFLRQKMRCIIFPSPNLTRSSRMQKGGRKSFTYEELDKSGKSEASATFMSTIWSRFRETWS
ncbi:MAG: Holliday junction resolvase RecU [[Clostridium] symbiosum]